MTVHPSAIIAPDAVIAPHASVGPFCVVGPGVVLGARTRLLSHVVIEHAELGEDCLLYPHAAIGLAPQHIGYRDEPTQVKIGHRCVFREGVTVHRGTMLDQGVTEIGDDGYFMNASHVAHDCRIGNNVTLVNGVLLAGHVVLEDRCFVSALAAFHQYVRVGVGAMVSGGARVVQDVAPYATVAGDRARLRGINLVGLRRAGVSRSDIALIKNAYRVFFHSHLTVEEALATPEMRVDAPVIARFRQFVAQSKRGIVRPAEKNAAAPAEPEEVEVS